MFGHKGLAALLKYLIEMKVAGSFGPDGNPTEQEKGVKTS